MNSSALVSFVRSLSRHKLYAALNIGGLALGIAVFVVLALFVRFERGYDRNLPEADARYVVMSSWHMQGLPDTPYDSTMVSLLEQMQAEFNGIEGTRSWSRDVDILRGDTAIAEDIRGVDSNFLEFFPYSVVAGDARGALDDPDAMLVTEAGARKYFGRPAPIGETLTLVMRGKKYTYRVAAVLRDPPKNESYTSDIYVPIVASRFTGSMSDHWGSDRLQTFLRLPNQAAARALEGQLPAFIDRRAESDQGPDFSKVFQLSLLPLTDVHLFDPGDASTVATLGIVGLLTLLIAVVNYVNLATARAGLRAREVALRKVLGGTRRALILQFLAEAVATVALAALIGLALTELALPFVNSASGSTLTLDYIGANGVLLPIIALVLVVGLLAGLYPALVLSHFRPAAVLAAARAPGGGRAGARLRQGLVVLQFAVAIAFAIGTAVMVSQTAYLRSASLGFERSGLVVVTALRNLALDDRQRERIYSEMARLPGVVSVTRGDQAPGFHDSTSSSTMRRSGTETPNPSVQHISVGPDYFRTYGIRVLAGRGFDSVHQLDNIAGLDDDQRDSRRSNVILNRRAATEIGFASPQAAIGKTIEGRGQQTVVGVVDDVRFRSPRDRVRPMAYSYYDGPMVDPILAVRYNAVDPAALITQMEQVWRQAAPDVPFDAKTADQNLYESYYRSDARLARLFTIGALLAVLIGCIGLYGLASFDTARRTKEIGIRKTLGATVPEILRLLIGQFLRPVVIANLIAWPLAWFAMRQWLSGFDDRVALSPLFFLAASVAALLVAVATVLGQSWRVARAEPARALRYE